MSPLSLLLFVAGGIFLVLAILSFRKPRMNVDGVWLEPTTDTLQNLRIILGKQKRKSETPPHLVVLRFLTKEARDQWICDHIKEIYEKFSEATGSATLFDNIMANLPGAMHSMIAAVKAEAESVKAEAESVKKRNERVISREKVLHVNVADLDDRYANIDNEIKEAAPECWRKALEAAGLSQDKIDRLLAEQKAKANLVEPPPTSQAEASQKQHTIGG